VAALACFGAGWLVGTTTGDPGGGPPAPAVRPSAQPSATSSAVLLLLDAGPVQLIDASLQLRPIQPPTGGSVEQPSKRAASCSGDAASREAGAADEGQGENLGERHGQALQPELHRRGF